VTEEYMVGQYYRKLRSSRSVGRRSPHELIAGGRTRLLKDQLAFGAPIHAIEHQTVQIDIQVGRRAESLDQRDRAGVGCGAAQADLPLAAEFGIRFTYAILFISALSFLGLGIQPPNADWGVMVRENLQGLLFGSAAPLIPAAAIATVTVAINLVVDGVLHDAGRGKLDEQVP
jgi:hypothetical protein